MKLHIKTKQICVNFILKPCKFVWTKQTCVNQTDLCISLNSNYRLTTDGFKWSKAYYFIWSLGQDVRFRLLEIFFTASHSETSLPHSWVPESHHNTTVLNKRHKPLLEHQQHEWPDSRLTWLLKLKTTGPPLFSFFRVLISAFKHVYHAEIHLHMDSSTRVNGMKIIKCELHSTENMFLVHLLYTFLPTMMH